MKFLFIAVRMGRHLSGGDINFIEIGRRILKKGHHLTVVTSEEGKTGCERGGLLVDFWIFDKGDGGGKSLKTK